MGIGGKLLPFSFVVAPQLRSCARVCGHGMLLNGPKRTCLSKKRTFAVAIKLCVWESGPATTTKPSVHRAPVGPCRSASPTPRHKV